MSNKPADTVLREFPALGSLRVRFLQDSRGRRVLDVREYVEADAFEGFTRRGIRLDDADRAQLADVLAQLVTGVPLSDLVAGHAQHISATSPRPAAPQAEPQGTPVNVRAQAGMLFAAVNASKRPAPKAPTAPQLLTRMSTGEVVAITGEDSLLAALEDKAKPAPKAPPPKRSLSDLAALL